MSAMSQRPAGTKPAEISRGAFHQPDWSNRWPAAKTRRVNHEPIFPLFAVPISNRFRSDISENECVLL